MKKMIRSSVLGDDLFEKCVAHCPRCIRRVSARSSLVLPSSLRSDNVFRLLATTIEVSRQPHHALVDLSDTSPQGMGCEMPWPNDRRQPGRSTS